MLTLIPHNRDKIVEMLRIGDLEFSIQDEIVSRFEESLMKKITLEIYDRLSAQDREALEALPGEVEGQDNFLREKIVGLDNLLEQATVELVQTYRGKKA